MPRHNRPTNLKTYISDSPGKGRGVFASELIKKGEIIEIAPTITIPVEDTEVLSLTLLANYFFASPGDETDVMAGGHASMYNHSFEPSATWAVGKGIIVIKATKNIPRGEEILINYGWNEESYEAIGVEIPAALKGEL